MSELEVTMGPLGVEVDLSSGEGVKKLIPLGKRVLVEPLNEVSNSPIVNVAEQEPMKGVVKEIGEDVTNVTIGDEVLFKQYAGIKLDDGNLIFREDDLLGVWR